MKKPLIMKQPPMKKVIYALLPLFAASVYFFGWRSLLIMAVVNAAGFLSEYIFALIYKKQVTAAVFVSNFLFALSLPPFVPLWIAAAGIMFGIIFGKMAFGGFGKNVFNPALTGRAFVYISFGSKLTSMFTPNFSGFPGGFAAFSQPVDAVTKATPLFLIKQGGLDSALNETGRNLFDLFFGFTSGSLGETSALLIILGGLYLLIAKTANYRIVAGGTASFLLFQTVLYIVDPAAYTNPVYYALSGSFLFAVMFMATDPVSASQTTNGGRWIYGVIIGILTVLIRNFSIWPEAVTFSILLANTFGPLIDQLMKNAKKKKEAVS